MNKFTRQFSTCPMDEKRDLTEWLFMAYTSLEKLDVVNARRALIGVNSLLTSTLEVNEALDLIDNYEYSKAKEKVSSLVVLAISNIKPMA